MSKINEKKLAYIADFLHLCSMKETDINTKLERQIPTLTDKIEELQKQLKEKEAEIKLQQEMIAALRSHLFGSSRDLPSKLSGLLTEYDKSDTQLELFEDELKQAYAQKEEEIKKTAKAIEDEANKRRKKSKKASQRPSKYLCNNLEERRTVVYPEGINPEDYDVIGGNETRILRRTPGTYYVEVIVLPKLRLKTDKNQDTCKILQAPAPAPVIKGNHVGADVLANIIIDKFVYHIPEYRQVKRMADLGVNMPTSTINDWVHAVANKLYPLYEVHCEDIRRSNYIQCDEVPWRIADKPDKCRNGYAWQLLDANPDTHGLYFYYYKGSRAGAIPRAQLKDFQGAIQTDGYAVYDYFEQIEGVTLLGCMAHVRRKFVDAQTLGVSEAEVAINYIRLFYELEENLKERGASAQDVARERKEKAIPIMETMEEWMKSVSAKYTPQESMGKALSYAYKIWPRLKRYVDDGRYQIDNNPVERGQRPTVLGRKNYLFSKNDRGAEDNAIFYSLLESCGQVGLSPLEWLTSTLEKLKDNMEEDELIRLLPYYQKKSQE